MRANPPADNAKPGRIRSTTAAEMQAYDALPPPLRDFVKTANEQWACGPMLRRARRCGPAGQWALPRLVRAYQSEDG